MVIETKGLALKSGHRYLLKDIDWQVKRGENWLIFGMNGSGKTTLLSILAGYRQSTAGKALLFGEEYTNQNALALRRRIGWVSSSFFDQCYSKEVALDIVLSGKFGTVGLDADLDDFDIIRAKSLLKTLGLAGKHHRPFHLLSKGERQNVLIARALFGKPEILMLDEPCSGLDILARERLLAMVRAMADNQDMTMIYVTHHTEEILTDVFPQTMFLKEGLIDRQGKTEALFTSSCFSDFLGDQVAVHNRAPYGYQTTVLR